ncbi:MAG: DUF5119 domain-containing protein [Paramuribaculum sp.]|nr:DUF5119 domain-containing protein [Paramuribaculum sp.]
MQTFRKRQKTIHNCPARILLRQSWAAAFCAACILLCGCHQKDLVYPDSAMIKISVRFDWTYAPDADPDGMTVVFFPEDDGGHIWRYELAGSEGGDIEIPAGSYRMMAFNNDTKHIFYSGTSQMESYKAFTQETVPVAWPDTVLETCPGIVADKIHRSPDALYCASAKNVSVGLCSVSYRPVRPESAPEESEIKECGRHIIKCYPEPRTCTYTCILRDVANIKGMRRGYFVLSGLSPSDLIARDILSDSEAEYLFTASRDDNDITGRTVAFGRSASPSARQFLYLVAVMADGRVAAYCRDVSGQVVNSPDKRNVKIIVDGIELPYVSPDSPDEGEPGFDVGVDDWELVIVDHVISLR